MQSGPGSDIIIDIEHNSDITGFKTFDIGGHGRQMIFHTVTAIDNYAVDIFKAIDQFLRQAMLLGIYLFYAARFLKRMEAAQTSTP